MFKLYKIIYSKNELIETIVENENFNNNDQPNKDIITILSWWYCDFCKTNKLRRLYMYALNDKTYKNGVAYFYFCTKKCFNCYVLIEGHKNEKVK